MDSDAEHITQVPLFSTEHAWHLPADISSSTPLKILHQHPLSSK